LLLGDDDRELFYETLKRHAAEGRLDTEELERRVTIVAEAATREAAAAALEGLPPLTPEPAEERRPRRGRGHGETDNPEPGWQPTNERFRDPRTRHVVRVWVDAAGARHYVRE
jgi:hypothetical protein